MTREERINDSQRRMTTNNAELAMEAVVVMRRGHLTDRLRDLVNEHDHLLKLWSDIPPLRKGQT